MPDRDDQKNQVQEATDLVRLIGEQIRLQPKGKEFAGLCPFHDDSSPSMFVSPAKQIYKCFACGAGGDAFSFVMNYHKMSFREALEFLAERAGITLQAFGKQGDQQGESEGSKNRKRLSRANENALNYFRNMLAHPQQGKVARDYLQQRGFASETIENFQIGYAPDGWSHLVDTIGRTGDDLRGYEMAGLVSPRKNADGHYDRMRHRLIFPICDAIGRPIAFGGRKLREEDEPKYLNSPETVLFNKSATLYGLHLAKQAILASRTAVIVEGYTDVTGCHQAGKKNVVATLGTALTSEHAKALRYFADKVVLIFDADEAGAKAADRAVEVFFGSELDVAIAVLPDGQDPAELLGQPDGAEQWDKAIKQGVGALDYQFNRMKRQFDDADSVSGRQRIAEQYLQQMAHLGLERLGPIRRSLVVQRLSELLHLSEDLINQMLKRLAPARPRRQQESSPPPPPQQDVPPDDYVYSEQSVIDESGNENSSDFLLANSQNAPKISAVAVAERNIIGCLIREPGLFQHTLRDGRIFDETVTPAEFVTQSGRSLYQFVYDRLAEGESLTLASALAQLAEAGRIDQAQLVTQAEMQLDAAIQDKAERLVLVFEDSVNTILSQQREQAYQQTRQQLLRGKDPGSEPGGLGGAEQNAQEKDEASLIKQLMEHRKASQSPVRIARPGGGA